MLEDLSAQQPVRNRKESSYRPKNSFWKRARSLCVPTEQKGKGYDAKSLKTSTLVPKRKTDKKPLGIKAFKTVFV